MDGMKVESKRSARSGEDAMRGNAKCVRCGMRETLQMFADMVYTYGLLIRSRRAACYAMERGVEHVPTRRIRETGYATGSQ
jgi:hypothetical protein